MQIGLLGPEVAWNRLTSQQLLTGLGGYVR
jgi:hypothetical protein